MSALDKVIGYKSIVEELQELANVLKDPSPFEALGAKIPRGLIIKGDPGLGKTLMAQCFIEETGWKSLLLRRTASSDKFLDEIKKVFDEAQASEPCIVFLDDLDKFANTDQARPNQPEYVAVQSCIDNIASHKVFVLATANDGYRSVPPSLVRPGRFDKTITLRRPEFDDACHIISHFLESRHIPNNVDADKIAQFPMTCAELENRINSAAISAVNAGRQLITTEDLMKACLEHTEGAAWSACDKVMDWREAACTRDYARRAHSACHEAGHLLVIELLDPGSANLAALLDSGTHRAQGIAMSRRDHDPFVPGATLEDLKIKIALGGLVAEEIAFGKWSMRSCSDLDRATEIAYEQLVYGIEGLQHLNVIGERHRRSAPSSENVARRETAAVDRINREMCEVRSMLLQNWELHNRIAQRLFEKGIVYGEEIDVLKGKHTLIVTSAEVA